jgi:hypothetical protein
MTTFNNFADRFHIVPQARFDAKPASTSSWRSSRSPIGNGR